MREISLKRRSGRGLWAAFALSIFANILALPPMLLNAHLGFTYRQTLAHWRSKFIPPKTVFLGDSITAGGRDFNHYGDINLGMNGLQTYQVAGLLPRAREYNPHHIVIMAGTNDAAQGLIDEKKLKSVWSQICEDPRVVVFLAPPSSSVDMNGRISVANSIARGICEKNGRTVISLVELGGNDGILNKAYTIDGVHFSEAAYAIWRSKLRDIGI